MGQLRKADTSELLMEGSPEVVALAAESIGFDKVIFDDVGEGFDPQAVLASYRESLEGLQSARAEETDAEVKQRLDDAIEDQRGAERSAEERAEVATAILAGNEPPLEQRAD